MYVSHSRSADCPKRSQRRHTLTRAGQHGGRGGGSRGGRGGRPARARARCRRARAGRRGGRRGRRRGLVRFRRRRGDTRGCVPEPADGVRQEFPSRLPARRGAGRRVAGVRGGEARARAPGPVRAGQPAGVRGLGTRVVDAPGVDRRHDLERASAFAAKRRFAVPAEEPARRLGRRDQRGDDAAPSVPGAVGQRADLR